MNEQTSVDFALQHADGWQVWIYILVAIFTCYWAWRRYGPTPPGFGGHLARVCRIGALVAIVALLTGPMWRITTTTTIPGRLIVAVDASSSMGREDWREGPRIDAAAELRRALEAKLEERDDLRVGYHRIGGRSGEIPAAEVDDLEADGTASPLGRELEELVFATGPELLVVVSDFRVTEGSDLAALGERLRGRRLKTALLGVGGEAVSPELALEEVVGPSEVALGERQPYDLRLVGRNLGDGELVLRVMEGDELLDRRTIQPEELADPVTLQQLTGQVEVTLHEEGEHKLRYVVEQGDLRAAVERTVMVSQRKLQVLMLAHRPRYEFRYLRAALLRDRTIDLHAYLFDGKLRRWGHDGPSALPLDKVAIADYDAIIVGDLGRDALRVGDLIAIEYAVRDKGSGLIWLPGERGVTASFAPARLGKMIPAELPDAARIAEGYLDNHTVEPRRTELAERLGLLESGGTAWEELPSLRGACPIDPDDGVRKNAEVLMEDQDGDPIVVSARYGSGMGLLIAVDDTWRWRRNVGDEYLNRFWSQLLRYVSSGRGFDDHRWRTQATPYRSVPGEEVTLAVVPSGVPPEAASLPDKVTVRLSGADGRNFLVPLERAAGEASFRSQVPAPGVGSWTIELAEGLGLDRTTPGELVVLPPRDELRDPRIDRAAMKDLARATGGAIYADPERLVRELPALSRDQTATSTEPLWTNWWPFLICLALLAVEWSLRRANRLP